MIVKILVFLLFVFILPPIVYMIVKYATMGYYSGKSLWKEPHEINNNNSDKE